jgi:hypothetical protein
MGVYLRLAAASIGLALVFSGETGAQDSVGPTNVVVIPPISKKKATDDGWTGEVAPNDTTGGITLDNRQRKLVQQVSDYFSALQNLKGAFVQIGADNKRMKGKFFVKRPGRFRFDYALPSKQIIISDGENLAIQDLDLNNGIVCPLTRHRSVCCCARTLIFYETRRSRKSNRPRT